MGCYSSGPPTLRLYILIMNSKGLFAAHTHTAKDGEGLLRVACCVLRQHAFVACGAAVWGWRTRCGRAATCWQATWGRREGNAMQRTASRDGATPCTLPLEKQLQHNLRVTLLKQNGCPYDYHRRVSFPRALTPELTARPPAQPFAV